MNRSSQRSWARTATITRASRRGGRSASSPRGRRSPSAEGEHVGTWGGAVGLPGAMLAVAGLAVALALLAAPALCG